MDHHTFAGSRIRERRIDQGMRQAEVASAAGISASYLNLIEHNKRRIGGKLLTALAEILDVSPETLSAGADLAVLDGMRSSATRLGIEVEMDRAEDLAVRLPGWANLIAAQNDRLMTLERTMQALTDRMEHDPKLADSLHELITSVTAIRATAGILLNEDRVDQDWQRRFHANLHADSRRLTDQTKALVSYLDRAPKVGQAQSIESPAERVETILSENAALIARINAAPTTDVGALVADINLEDEAAVVGDILSERVSQLAQDARDLPFAPFLEAAIASEAAPEQLAMTFRAPLMQVFRRIAYLPDDKRLPARGLVVANSAGTVTHVKAVRGFRVSRQIALCPRWPLFTALQQLGHPVQYAVDMGGATGGRFMCYGVAETVEAYSFAVPPSVESAMLIIADPAHEPAVPFTTAAQHLQCDCSYCRARR